MSEEKSLDPLAAISSEARVPPNRLEGIVLEGEVRLKASMSMLFSDILSQELNASISAPESLAVLQKYLRNKPLEQLNPSELKPFLENIPAPVIDVVKEAVFCSGAVIKRIHCRYPLKLGDSFIFRGSGLMADLELLDGRVVAIKPLKHR